jgi:hypothetical protein
MYYNPAYLINNNPAPEAIQFKIVTGNRSIGKTHSISKYLINNLPDDEAIGYILRYDKYKDITPWGLKFFPDAETVKQKKGMLTVDDNIKAYALPISTAYKTKNMNYDNPYIRNCIMDECIAPEYVRNEFVNLIILLGTISRRTGHAFTPLTVWCTGNIDVQPYAPIFDMLKLSTDYINIYHNPEQELKRKGIITIDNIKYGYVWHHTPLESPDNVANIRPESQIIMRPDWINPDNFVFQFKSGKLACGVWHNGYTVFIGQHKQAHNAPTLTAYEKGSLRRYCDIMEKRGAVHYESIEVMQAALG